ncbi:MAG: DUF1549 domain-containing protein [Planctomycetaceae bacterium]|nr:DUF1549 domain-containing protein [Planctomycetaceae bacterium]
MKRQWSILWAILVVVGVLALTSAATRPPKPRDLPSSDPPQVTSVQTAAAQVDAELARLWAEREVTPAPVADDLTILRRLSLALHGTIPSLEEIRRFEADDRADRLDHWVAGMLEDQRFADYFAERLARAYVGVEEGQFVIFRRDRFKAWLSGQLADHVPYDQIVREMIAAEGVWTGDGEVNFLTAAFANGSFDPSKLTARTTRAFLGQRIDCAQCHDHPFDHWKQSEFEGLTAFYGKLALTPAGVVDRKKKQYRIKEAEESDDEGRLVEPAVPFSDEWCGDEGRTRFELAAWITHAENQRFERAIANRVWALMFGEPFRQDRPVDDLPDPDVDPDLRTLDLLGADFRAHDCDLRRLIRVIASTQAFRMSSVHPETANVDLEALSDREVDELRTRFELTEETWGVFPLVRLRPEQVIGSMLQATYIHTVDQNSHLLTRFLRFARENNFVEQFGDPGVDELQERVGTIPQALLRMNGNLSRELTEPNPFLATGRIAGAASTPEKMIETAYLVCLTRRPTPQETEFFVKLWNDEPRRNRNSVAQDLYWDLFNSPEFSWNH